MSQTGLENVGDLAGRCVADGFVVGEEDFVGTFYDMPKFIFAWFFVDVVADKGLAATDVAFVLAN